MSYHDPYAHGQYAQQYQDAPFNPYEVQQQQANRAYAGGYPEGSGQAHGGYDDGARSKEGARSGFDHDDATPPPMGEKTPGNVRQWRKEYQGNLWTKGSRLGCFGRFFCCTVMIFLFLVISVVLSLALWLRPPNIIVGQPTVNVSSVNISGSSISVGLPVDISVNNPNYFTVELYTLDASVIYPVNNTQVGSGHMTNVQFKDHTQTNFTFPVTIDYNAASDPSYAVITDLAKHCGIDPNTAASDITVTVSVKVGVKVMLVPFSTTISQQATFACPLSGNTAQLKALLQSLGINISALAGLLL